MLDIHSELPADLQRVLEDDLVLLQQQIENLRLEQLHSDLKNYCERLEKQPLHRAMTIPFFAGQNAPSGNIAFSPFFHFSTVVEFLIDSEIVKPVLDSTSRVLKTYAPKILSVEVDRLLQEVTVHFIVSFEFQCPHSFADR